MKVVSDQSCCMDLRHEQDEYIMRKYDRRMLRYMTGVKWQDGVSSEEVAKRCGLGGIQERIRQGRLQWFGHVRREGDVGVLRMVEKMQRTLQNFCN